MELHARFYKKHSLSSKITALIVVTACILGLLAVVISFRIYCESQQSRYETLCDGILDTSVLAVDGDMVNAYLKTGEDTPGYHTVERELQSILDSFSDIAYLYVYQIRSDGCHVLFDCDTPGLPGEALGAVIPTDASFAPYIDRLLAGKEIPPITSNDSYGWLMTVYRPVFDSDGKCVAYIGVDVAMTEVRAERYVFIIRIISLLTGATILIVGFAVWFAQRRIVYPINRLSLAAGQFAYNTETARAAAAEMMQGLHIQTGDEIETLYASMSKMMRDVVEYVQRMNEQRLDIARKAAFIEDLQDNIIMTFADMIENRDQCTGEHVRHTAAYVRIIGTELLRRGDYPDVLTADYLADMVKSAPLHDVGKIRVPDCILNKPGRLTPEEYAQIKLHTTAGRAILQEAFGGMQGKNYLAIATEMATWHHEKWDGSGYPDGLSGEAIPLCARVMAVADVFDALVSRRSYKEPYAFDDACVIIRDGAGRHFDPTVVDAFLHCAAEVRAVAEWN